MTHVMDKPLQLPWWKKPQLTPAYIAGGVILGLAVLTILFWSTRERSFRTPLNNVTISTVSEGVFHDFVPLHGLVVPKDAIEMDALVGGQVERILVQAGDQVEKGQPIIVFRNENLQLNVLRNESQTAQSIAQIQNQQNQLETTRANNESQLANIRYQIANLEHLVARYDPLFKEGALDAKTVQQAHDQLDYYRTLLPLQLDTNARAEKLRVKQLPGLQAEEDSLLQSLTFNQNQLEALTEKAPVAGKLTMLGVSKIGENINPGTRLAEINPPTGFKITADIDEYYLARVKAGQSADIDVDGIRYKLRVARVYPQVKNGTFTADFTFDGKAPQNPTQGASVDGKLSLGADDKALILPSGAFLEASGGDYVFVLDAGGSSAHRRRVKLGRRNVEQVEVLSGLAADERVITSDYSTYDKIDRIDLTK